MNENKDQYVYDIVFVDKEKFDKEHEQAKTEGAGRWHSEVTHHLFMKHGLFVVNHEGQLTLAEPVPRDVVLDKLGIQLVYQYTYKPFYRDMRDLLEDTVCNAVNERYYPLVYDLLSLMEKYDRQTYEVDDPMDAEPVPPIFVHSSIQTRNRPY